MIVGGRARTTIIEIDLSDRVPGFPGVYGAMALDTKKGSWDPYMVTSDSDFLKRYTLYEKVQVGDSLGLFEACFFLEKNNKLWICRAENGSKHGVALLNQDKPFNSVGVIFNTTLFTMNLKSVTKEERETAEVMYDALSTGEICEFSVDDGVQLPDGLIKENKYYLIPYDKETFAYRLASTYDNALEGKYVEFTGDFTGNVSLSFGKDKVNAESPAGAKDPTQYQLNTSDGLPAGINSTFNVDLDNDRVNVSEQFWNACVTGDELTIIGSSLPTVATGTPIDSNDTVYCIRTEQTGVNFDKFKIQLARTKTDAGAGRFINFATPGKQFTLKFNGKDNSDVIDKDHLDVVTDTITCSDAFYKTCMTNDAVKFVQEGTSALPVVTGDVLDPAVIYYIVKGLNNKIQICRERNGATINFTTELKDDQLFKLTLVDKAKSSNSNMDLSNDTLHVGETFYEYVETGYTCKVKSDGTLPNGINDYTTYYVIKLDTPNLVMLASTKENAELGVPVDITSAGVLDTEMNEVHTITDTHNTLYTGFNEAAMLVATKTPTSEDIYITLQHYPYGTEDTWSDVDKVVARTLVEPYSFKLDVYKKYEDGSVMQVESWLMSRKKDAMDGSQTNIYCEEVAKRSSYITVVDNPNVADSIYPCNQPTMLKLAGGTDGDTATTGAMIQAIEKLANRRRYNVTLIMDAGYAVPAYQQAIIGLCESRQYTAGILSTPISCELSANYRDDLLNYRNVSLNSATSYAALYSPHLKVYDKYNNREIFVSPTGHVGAQISETGANQEMWFPVAGNRRGVLNVLGLSRIFEPADEDELYENQINPIDFNTNKGIRIWGQKTLLRRNSALDRLNVRLLLVYIEPAIHEFLDDFLFELNDKITRDLIQTGLTGYMEGIKARRGVYDFRVICDESNNTAEDIDSYVCNVHVILQPTKAIEYINCYIVITRTGSTMSIESLGL